MRRLSHITHVFIIAENFDDKLRNVKRFSKYGGGGQRPKYEPDKDVILLTQTPALSKSGSYLPSAQILSQDF